MADDFRLGEINPAAIDALLSSDQTRAHLMDLAQKVLDRAKATAPRKTGALAESHEIRVDESGKRVRVRVGATVPYGAVVASRDPYLASALDAAAGGSEQP